MYRLTVSLVVASLVLIKRKQEHTVDFNEGNKVIVPHFPVRNCEICVQLYLFFREEMEERNAPNIKHIILQDAVRMEEEKLKGDYRSPEQVGKMEGISAGGRG